MDRDAFKVPDPAWIIWVALASSPLLFLAVAWLIAEPEAPLVAPLGDTVVLILGGMALAAFYVGVRVVEGFVREPAAEARGQRSLILLIVRLALFEVIAVMGMLAAVLTGRFEVYLPFMLLSLVGMVLYRPRG